MRVREILSEKIVSNPRNLPAYLKQRMKLLDTVIPLATEAVAVIKAADSESDYLVRHAIKFVSDYKHQHLPDAYYLDLDRRYSLTDLRQNMDAIARFGPADFLRYALNTLEHIRPISDEDREVLGLMSQVDAGFQDYGFVPGERETDSVYIDAKRLADAYIAIARIIALIEPMIAQFKGILLHIQKRQAFNFRPEEYRPDHGEIETLYHATMYATEIARDGFSVEKPDGRVGVGNLGQQPEISFTHDIRIAHDIMRAMREMCLIVHGEVTRRDVVKWLQAENIDPNHAAKYFVHSREDINSIPQVIRLYQAYLGLSKIRMNPVFIGPEKLIDQLRSRSVKDIGIVSCEVRLDGKEEYMHGEAEFRVMASRIVGPVKRVI